MNAVTFSFARLVVLAGMALLIAPQPIDAFPPAPHHLVYGMVRDELGAPLSRPGAKIILETPAGVQIKADVVAGLAVGVNYRLVIPMDSAVTPEPYKAHALQATAPFRIKVLIGTATYAPIEMSGDLATLGDPGESTRLDLTLGEDSDGDGLPDAWERWLAAMVQDAPGLGAIHQDSDSDGDGRSDYDEYIAGTYAFDARDAFTLKILSGEEDQPVVELATVRTRTYTLFETSDFATWAPVEFRLATEPSTAPPRASLYAGQSGVVQVRLAPGEGRRFFKVRVQ